MAAVFAHVPSGEVTFVASSTKTILAVFAGTTVANPRVLVHGIRLTGKQPAGGTDSPVRVIINRITNANIATGTSGTTPTIAKNDPTDAETLASTAKAGYTVEPTYTSKGIEYELQPQSGILEMFSPGQEWKIPGGEGLAVTIITPAGSTPTIDCTLMIQE